MVAFGKGFSYTRSLTHPYECVFIGPLMVMRDAPGKKQDPRVEEIVVHGVSPQEADRMICEYCPAKFGLSPLEGMDFDHDALKEQYKAMNYRLRGREPMFVRDLASAIPSSPEQIIRVMDMETADALNGVTRTRQILPSHLGVDDAPLRQYAAMHEGKPVGWVRSIDAGDHCRWVSNLYVQPEHRRKGLARALMNKMLADDKRLGATHSVLLASNAGSHLYPTLGYEQIGLLQLFTPPR